MSEELVEQSKAVVASNFVFEEDASDERHNLSILDDVLELMLQIG